ncbi:glycosyl hydrolase family 28 protein [Fibrella aquatilis]|uniref:Right-handed parallel beta-helix repeat-containing protein n=1 Tax=Fibrella aquatilis TaxID=2817059 RepID=A0A939G7Z0_9BACT|nr:glycosyl hydrolase family 28 protein [Fibrella aquatilis]MBO0933874.1 right-handed parallel beta-helix repeat-containing protein [Fibrella aquatilis]
MNIPLLSFFLLTTSQLLANQLITYPAPDSARQATDFSVTVNGKPVFVYDNAVSAMTTFSFAGSVLIEITSTHDLRWVDIRPKSLAIPVSVTPTKLTFRLTKPGQLSIERNGEHTRALYVFAAPPEQDVPKPTDPGVRYFAPGKIYDVGTLTLNSNETIYIAGGAIVRGNIQATDAKNIRIRGRGILDASQLKGGRLVRLWRCQQIDIEGITITDSPGWTLVLLDCDHVTIHDLKEVCWRNGSDGIDLVGTSHVQIRDCFLRNNDDNIVIKSFSVNPSTFYSQPGLGRDVTDILVERCVIWNMPWGNALEIGFELRCQTINTITFRNCDLIHVDRGAALSIHNGDQATVERITYDNIRVEDAPHKLVDLAVFWSQYSTDMPTTEAERARQYLHGAWDGVLRVAAGEVAAHARSRGQIRDILFRNIAVTDGQFPYSILCGYDARHRIENVRFKGLTIHGKPIRSAQAGHFSLENATRVYWK